MRAGLIAYKVGMTSIAVKDLGLISVTLLHVDDLVVLEKKTKERDGYTAIKLGLGTLKKPNHAQQGFFAKHNLPAKRFIKEFPVSDDFSATVGQRLTVDHFQEDQYVDAAALSIGRGFAGGMRRHNFSGLPASHGASLVHRQIGSTGQCQDPGRTWPGKKMPGRLGATRITMQNLKVVRIDSQRGLIFVKGNVPGIKGAVVYLVDAKRKPAPKIESKPSSDAEQK